MTLTTVVAEHENISARAADIANGDERLAMLVMVTHGCWRPASAHASSGGLCIEYDEAQRDEDDEWWADGMRQIGEDALSQAVHENLELIVGLMVGEAREGRNYFSRFA